MSIAAEAAFDMSGMTVFETGDRWIPRIFLSMDHNCVFVRTLDALGTAQVTQASTAEIKRLARRYHLPELLDALPSAVAV